MHTSHLQRRDGWRRDPRERFGDSRRLLARYMGSLWCSASSSQKDTSSPAGWRTRHSAYSPDKSITLRVPNRLTIPAQKCLLSIPTPLSLSSSLIKFTRVRLKIAYCNARLIFCINFPSLFVVKRVIRGLRIMQADMPCHPLCRAAASRRRAYCSQHGAGQDVSWPRFRLAVSWVFGSLLSVRRD